MKTAKKLRQATAVLAILALGVLALSPDALADRRRHHAHGVSPRPHIQHLHAHPRLRVVLAAPVILPAYRYFPEPRQVIVTPSPVYIERSPYVPPGYAQGYWYYCGSAGAYYPYVSYCPEGWQQVVPQPPR